MASFDSDSFSTNAFSTAAFEFLGSVGGALVGAGAWVWSLFKKHRK